MRRAWLRLHAVRLFAALLAALATIVGASPAPAEHEVFYRYTMLGYVRDARGAPVAGREVKIVRDKTGFSYLAETDPRGLYVLVLRLGDESLGERLTVHTGAASGHVTVQFDPANRADERGTRLDFEHTRFVERAAWFPSTLALFLNGRPQTR